MKQAPLIIDRYAYEAGTAAVANHPQFLAPMESARKKGQLIIIDTPELGGRRP